MVAFHGFPSYRIAGILPALLLMERWQSAGCLYLFFLPHAGRCHQVADPGHAVRREMVAFHGFPSYRIAGILPAIFLTGSLVSRPAVFIFSSCYTSADATRDGGVPWLSLLSERWSPDRQSLSFLPAVRGAMPPGWWRSMAFPLIGSLASCRLFF
jgi:hypothetical protein